MCEVKQRFPRSVAYVACLAPHDFHAFDAGERVSRLAAMNNVDEASSVSRRRQAHHVVAVDMPIHEAYRLLP